MTLNVRLLTACALIAGSLLSFHGIAASTEEGDEANSIMSSYEQQQRAAANARKKDPAWKPACAEIGLIQIGDKKKPGALKNFCLDATGNILACFAPNDKESSKSSAAKSTGAIRVYSPKGQLLKTLPVEIRPTAICVAKDGAIFAAGSGKILKLDADGKVLASATSPVIDEPVKITSDIEKMVKDQIKVMKSNKSFDEELARMKTMLEKRRSEVTGLAVSDQDVFMAVPAPSDFTYRVYRFSHALENPKMVVEKLRGCCGQMDIQSHDGKLWIPHNARHLVEAHDRDGKELLKFGKTGRVKASDFGGCCEPKNMRILPGGEILAAESGPPTCIKQFTADGKFVKVIALTDAKGECVRCTVERSPDGSRYYLMDTEKDAIHIFGTKG
jgi:hypothetical protein